MKITLDLLDLTHLKNKPFLLADLRKILEQQEKRPTKIIITKKQATYLTSYGEDGKLKYWDEYRGIPLKII